MAHFQLSGNQSEQQNQQQNGITTKRILRYALLPEILPRIRAIGFHFGHFAYLLALVFSSARLIPQGHPILNAANIGQYTVRQVIALAANNITWSFRNMDQIAIFGAIVVGLILIFLQTLLIAFAALAGFGNEANAQVTFFDSVSNNDPILILFANIFGDLSGFWDAPGAAGSVAANAPNSGNIIHEAIRAMLSLYSLAMMVVAVIIVIYYIMTVVGEAAKTGTPFGQRFNSLWAPIRLVVALGLLVPLGTGLNSAQYITLWLAKQGSGLGTTVWNEALNVMNPSGANRFLLDDFTSSWVHNVTYHVFLMEVCAQGYNKYNAAAGDKVVRGMATDTSTPASGDPNRRGRNGGYKPAKYGYEIRYQNEERNFLGMGGAYCGNLSINMSEEDVKSSITAGAAAVPTVDIFNASKQTIENIANTGTAAVKIKGLANRYVNEVITIGGPTDSLPNNAYEEIFNELKTIADAEETALRSAFASVGTTDMAQKMQDFINSRGESWAYAGTYYMEIARIIQASHDARLNAIPNTAIVEVEDVQLGQIVHGRNRGRGNPPLKIQGVDGEVSRAVYNAMNYYESNIDQYLPNITEEMPEACQGINDDSEGIDQIGCTIFSILVPEHLVLLAKDSTRSLDPLAALVAAGYNIVDRSWKLLLASMAFSVVGNLLAFIPWLGFLGGILGAGAEAAASIFTLIATLGLAAGVILYFMLPIFPFMYFFFAIVSWFMEIFEAIIAMPLWALAHLRIDGDGMPGGAAINGYFLLLAILLRPALIVMGLIAGIIIFSGVTFLLQNLWDDVLFVKGAGNMNGLEVLIYTIVFAFFCYIAAMTCFKLVDSIPNQIIRWIGSTAGTFSDNKDDPAGGSNALLTGGAGFIAGSGAQALTGGFGKMGHAAGQGLKGTKFGERHMMTGAEKRAAAESEKKHEQLVNALKGSSKET